MKRGRCLAIEIAFEQKAPRGCPDKIGSARE